MSCRTKRRCCNTVVPNSESVPVAGDKNDGVITVTSTNICGDSTLTEDVPSRMELFDADGNVAAEVSGTYLADMSTWTDEIGNMSQFLSGTMDNFTFDFGAWGAVNPMNPEIHTFKTYFDCDGTETTNPNNSTSVCLEPNSLFFVVEPDSPAVAEVLGFDPSRPNRAWEVGQTYHKKFKFTLGRNITGIWESDNFGGLFGEPNGAGTGFRIAYQNRGSYVDNPANTDFNSYPNGTDTNRVTMTFDVPQDCFIVNLFYDNSDLGIGEVLINGGQTGFTVADADNYGAFNTTTYPDGTFENIVGAGNDQTGIAAITDTFINTISFKVLKDARAIWFDGFQICNCDGEF